LLEQGANPRIATGYRSLPLHYAAAHGSRQICELLSPYHYTFDIHEKDNAGHSALAYALSFGNTSVIELLSEDSIGQKDKTVIRTARMDDPTTQKSLPEVDQQPVIGAPSAPVQLGNTVERSSAIFSQHLTSNMSMTSSISPASHTTKPNEVLEPLGIVIDHILRKSRYCDTNDVLGVAAIIEKLRWHTSRGHELPNNTDTQHCELYNHFKLLLNPWPHCRAHQTHRCLYCYQRRCNPSCAHCYALRSRTYRKLDF
jgi:hypothetical protein